MSNNSTETKRCNSVILTFICILLIGMASCFLFVDKPAISWIQKNNVESYETSWMEALEQLGKIYPLLWLLLFWVLITGKYKKVVLCILSLLITFGAVVSIKTLIQRERPINAIKAQINIEKKSKEPNHWSFPSGDTAEVCAAGIVLGICASWPWVIGIVFCCGSIGILRIMELAHYPSDILAGAALGIFCGWSAIRIRNRYPEIENIFKGREKILSFIGVILIPVLIWRLQDQHKLIILFEFYAPIVVIIAIVNWRRQLKQN